MMPHATAQVQGCFQLITSYAPPCKVPHNAHRAVLPARVAPLPIIPPIGAVSAVCHAKEPNLLVILLGSNPNCHGWFTFSIPLAIFSAHAVNFSPIGRMKSCTGVQGSNTSKPEPPFLVR